MDKPDLIRHIAKGQQHILASDYEPLLADINDEMKHLTLDTLTELYKHVRFLRTRQQVIPCSSTERQAGGFDGSTGKRSLKVNVETIGFKGLIRLACELNVPHDDYSRWLEDEWPDKTDDLRVAVAEAMGKVGK